MTQVVAVTGGHRLVDGLTSAFGRAGIDLQIRTHRELVAEVEVEQCEGQEPRVRPDRPLLWLSAVDGGDGDPTPDGRFLAYETMAAARSIATVTRSPVLNRPTAVSATGRLPASVALTVRQARHLLDVRAESFTSAAPDGDVEVHDYATGRNAYGRPVDGIGPYRHRAARQDRRLVRVVVVGTRTITTSPVREATIDASVRLAAWYALDLAAVWWLVDDGATPATLARIDATGWDRVDGVAEAVVAWLADRTRVEVGG